MKNYVILLVSVLTLFSCSTKHIQKKVENHKFVIDYIAASNNNKTDIYNLFDGNAQTYISGQNTTIPYSIDVFFEHGKMIDKIAYTQIGNEKNMISITTDKHNYRQMNMQKFDMDTIYALHISLTDKIKKEIEFYDTLNAVHTRFLPSERQFPLGDIVFYNDSAKKMDLVLPKQLHATIKNNVNIAIGDMFFAGENRLSVEPFDQKYSIEVELLEEINISQLKIYPVNSTVKAADYLKRIKIRHGDSKQSSFKIPTDNKIILLKPAKITTTKSIEFEVELSKKAIETGYLPFEFVLFDNNRPVNLFYKEQQTKKLVRQPIIYSLQDSRLQTKFLHLLLFDDNTAQISLSDDNNTITSVTANWKQHKDNELQITALMQTKNGWKRHTYKLSENKNTISITGMVIYKNIPRTALVNIKEFMSDAVVEIPYATTENFIGKKVYPCSECLLRYEAAKAIKTANDTFMQYGYRIKFLDCYRPVSVQRKMWEILPNPVYVANPNKSGSMHNRGTAIDLTLIDKDGNELDMGTAFDHFGPEAAPTYTALPENVLANRKLLAEKLLALGFQGINSEWWHFSYRPNHDLPIVSVEIRCNKYQK